MLKSFILLTLSLASFPAFAQEAKNPPAKVLEAVAEGEQLMSTTLRALLDQSNLSFSGDDRQRMLSELAYNRSNLVAVARLGSGQDAPWSALERIRYHAKRFRYYSAAAMDMIAKPDTQFPLDPLYDPTARSYIQSPVQAMILSLREYQYALIAKAQAKGLFPGKAEKVASWGERAAAVGERIMGFPMSAMAGSAIALKLFKSLEMVPPHTRIMATVVGAAVGGMLGYKSASLFAGSVVRAVSSWPAKAWNYLTFKRKINAAFAEEFGQDATAAPKLRTEKTLSGAIKAAFYSGVCGPRYLGKE